MSIWKKQAAQSIVNHAAPAVTATPTSQQGALADVAQTMLIEGKIPSRDQDFVKSLMASRMQYGSLTERQEAALRRVIDRVNTSAQPSADLPLAQALALAIPTMSSGDARFAQSLLDGFAKYNSFTDRQRPYVERLLGTAAQRDTLPTPVATPVGAQKFPNLTKLVSLVGFARFTVGALQLSLKNDGSAIWAKYDGTLFGVIDPRTQGFRSLTRGLSPDGHAMAKRLLDDVEQDPRGKAAAHGIATGRCSCCGRPLTDPSSIAIGIGPICLDKAGW